MTPEQKFKLSVLRNYVKLIAEQCEGERPWGCWGESIEWPGRNPLASSDAFESPRSRDAGFEYIKGDYDNLFANPYVLIETSHYGQTYVTLHASADEAIEYHVNQESAEDWRIDRLVDVRDMTEYRMSAKAERA